MSLPDRKETEVRLLLRQSVHPVVPPDLALRAAVAGERLLRRRRALLALVWAVLLFLACGAAVWLSIAQPWSAAPETTPTVGW
ncbi:hypothetical protein [Streptomyces xiaopingdaonensis]|uniref:hypothetical protein n=1 Tax=Streptomyces xiaopingdaonensis TaxID=1565415 RepID=UPI00037FBC23|nr:hypothetical protein [Streptomyces xiaopingdaonensis]